MDERPKKRAKISSVELKWLLQDSSSSLSELINPVGPPTARPLTSKDEDDMVGPSRAIRKEEFIRIITQALYSLGYEKIGAALEEESGTYVYSSVVKHLRKKLLDGNWDESVAILRDLDILDENTLKSASFLLYEHKFFELLGKNRDSEALKTLRTEISSLGINKKRAYELSCYIIVPSQRAVVTAKSQGKLLEELQKILPPTVMIPERRLEHLVEQASNLQKASCFLHNSLDALSLHTDHQCEKDQIPSQTIQILQAHKDEVWFVKFSNNGRYLASTSKDKTAIVWEVREDGKLSPKYVLIGHESPVVMVAWSPDDQQLLTCGFEEVVARWDVSTGKFLNAYRKAGVLGQLCCGWFGREYLCCGDTSKTVSFWDLAGTVRETYITELTTKNMDLAITRECHRFIYPQAKNCILAVDKESNIVNRLHEDQAITSFSLSSDGDLVLVNLANQEIHLWRTADPSRHIMSFKGHKRSRFVIRSCFGGAEEAFVASGSEDSRVYIWQRDSGKLIHKLPGHSGVVNCVSWNPVNPHMLASASDDHTIRIWGTNTKTNLKPKNTPSNNGKGKRKL